MFMNYGRILPVLAGLFLLSGCSGERKAPLPVASPAGDVASPAPQSRGGSPVEAGASRESAAALRNSPPEIRGVRFIGGDGRPGSTLGVEAEGRDADGDAVQFEIAWSRNGEPAGTGNRLASPLKRGDKVSVTVTPFDGKERGKSTMLFREILNTPPAIEGQEQFQVSDNAVTFHVRASDADGDPLAYSLKDAPAGMNIDPGTGWIRWITTPGTPGKVPFTVIVSDGAGGESTARFSVTISEQPPSGAR
jgi:hypothetical protein